MPYGHFDDEAREYVITRPDTPWPWINYLGCEEFFGIVSNTAGGYCFYRDARLRRLTRYRYNNVPLDGNGRYLYVRDGDTLWNPGWMPTQTPLDHYECRHGLGYTTLTGCKDDLEVSVTYFVPLGATAEVWDVRVRNLGAAAKTIRLFGFVEWCLWDAMDDMTNFQRNFSTGQVEVEDDGASLFHVTEYRERRNHFAYFACSRAVDGFDTARDAFLGLRGNLAAPKAILAGGCAGSIAHGWAPVAAQEIRLELEPGRQERFHFLLGYAENPEDEKWTAPGVANKAPFRAARVGLAEARQIDGARAALRDHWTGLLGRFQVDIDQPALRRMVNLWNPYQCMTTFNLSRSASLFESGIGRGMGFRDSNQDILGFVHLIPDRARGRILDLAATQRVDGSCYHQYQPLTKKGNEDVGGGFNDDPLWLVLSTAAYVKETGDLSILDEAVGFADGDAPGSLLDHLAASVQYTLDRRGPHGLPLIGHADWNDCLNLNCFSTTPGESFQLAGDIEGSRAESVMIAGLFCAAAGELAELHRLVDRLADADALDVEILAMRELLETVAWDGKWFLRAFDAAGKAVGSAACEEGRIFIESQGWAVLGGAGLESGRALRALDSVAERLAKPNGIVLQQPAYAAYHIELGEISSYPPGYKENAGIFTHNNTWIQIAECILGRGDRALDYYLRVCPANKEEQIDTYRLEPYVYSQMTAGPDAPGDGEGRNSWLTGTAAWSLVAATQYILGIRPAHDGLRIAPCLPSDLNDLHVTRLFRGKRFDITIRNGEKGKGVAGITLNGQALEGDLLPIKQCRNINTVEVQLQ
jgi:cellobiose phosphorylase